MNFIVVFYHPYEKHPFGCFYLFRQAGEHIFNEDAVAPSRIIYQNVSHRADELSVLHDGATTHVCVNIGPTYEKTFLYTLRKPSKI